MPSKVAPCTWHPGTHAQWPVSFLSVSSFLGYFLRGKNALIFYEVAVFMPGTLVMGLFFLISYVPIILCAKGSHRNVQIKHTEITSPSTEIQPPL